ncbi:DUF2750 domain-containing protein [Thalassotalea profundi]|uniref:DUF2750 domain-containing protein n=1 Tax=Thalassotalea profundi TaxID=2036687 RepID=A0ABQ3J7J1_9GAMM|nr:DUF2750 domain-containing protein [Thalassotalea profundi]GHF02837.1 hypothetical protein GCM10011501_35160 [Thalassotalea profundi]
MNMALEKLNDIKEMNDEKRADYFIKAVIENNKIWILTDEHGCVMLNTEDGDCVPVWPNEEFAQLWATEEWQSCKAESISLNKWFSRWTAGLLDDEISIVVFPNESDQGMIYEPDDLENSLKAEQKKQSKSRN